MFTLREILTEKSYDNLIANFIEYENWAYDNNCYYNENNIIETERPIINNSKYYNEFVQYIFKNSRTEYVKMDSNIKLIIDSIINVVKTGQGLSYSGNPFLDAVSFEGETLDYEIKVTSSLMKVTNVNSQKGFLSPFKYESIIRVLDPNESSTGVTLYSIIDSFPYKKNDYFMTIYSLFVDYIKRKVSNENKEQIERIIEDLTSLTDGYKTLISDNTLGIYIKYSSGSYVGIEIKNIEDIDDEPSNFPINDNDGFVSAGIYYIKFDKYSNELLKLTDTSLNILDYDGANWNTVLTDTTTIVTTDETVITIDSVSGDTFETSDTLTIGEYVSDITNCYKILQIVGTTVTYDKTEISSDITIGSNYTSNPDINRDTIVSAENNKSLQVDAIVNNLQVFIFDFELSGVEILDLEYYTVSMGDEFIDYSLVHDSILNYIKVEQDKIRDMI